MHSITDSLDMPGLMAGGWSSCSFVPFRAGVQICRLWQAAGSEDQTAIALLRYDAGASIPRHRHTGVETIIVLDGVQSDERGHYAAGTQIVNPVGSIHSVWSAPGCVVWIQWNRPVEFLLPD